jgi:hypothetical protein
LYPLERPEPEGSGYLEARARQKQIPFSTAASIAGREPRFGNDRKKSKSEDKGCDCVATVV